jgi:1-deoxy-D-xylulose-5-phosphate reductoisomerase
VAAYLAGAISFPGIAALVEAVCSQSSADISAAADVSAALAIDQDARKRTRMLLSQGLFAVT